MSETNMENKKPTITIGIPAYNEKQNIGHLLNSLISQNTSSGDLSKILVVSDASTDKTVEIVKSFSDPRIEIIQKEKREGAYKAQNMIVELTNSDILIMLNADILPAGTNFLEELIKPILADAKVGIVCGEMVAAKPRTFFEKIMINSYEIKKNIYNKINQGHNLYNCVGVARAFSKNLYKKIKWPEDLPEDAYSYFTCISNGFEFIYNPKAKLIFRTPSNFKDHMKQSTRFFGGQAKMTNLFGKEIAEKEYGIPSLTIAGSIIIFLIKAPILTVFYLAIMVYIKLFLSKSYQAKWQIAMSTKEGINTNYP